MALKLYKKKLNYSYALGTFPVIELLQTKPEKVLAVLVSSKAAGEGIEKVRELCRKHQIRIDIGDKAIGKIAIKEKTQVLAAFKKYSADPKADTNHIVLVEPSLPGNLGTVIRTAVGFEIPNIILIGPSVDFFDPMVVRASMGALFKANYEHFDTFEEYREKYPQNKVYPFVLNGKNDLRNIKFEQPCSLVFGNEGEGLDKKFEKMENTVKISHSQSIESLNLSTATGLALYKLYNS